MKNERDSDIATITSHFFGARVKSEGFQQNLGESKMSEHAVVAESLGHDFS